VFSLILFCEQVLVDLALLQSVSYIAGALGVCVAAIYYIMNLREITLNRRIQFTTNFILPLTSREGIVNYAKLIACSWTNIEDFMKKYDHKVDQETFLARMSYFQACEVLGYQYKRSLVDIGTVYEMCGEFVIDIWAKYKSIIFEYKKLGQYGGDAFLHFEYLAVELAKIKQKRDPNYWALKIIL
jgi:hypothetical protein